MKNKLKILFAYFRGISDFVETTLMCDRSNIEDWDRRFITSEGNYVRSTTSIENIIYELFQIYYDEIRGYLNFEIDEYWILNIEIDSKKKVLIFRASCKEETSNPFERDYEYTDLDEERQGNIDFLYSEFPDTAKIEFEGYGRWGDGDIYEFYVDGKIIKITSDYDDVLWNIGNYFMTKLYSRYWNDEAGSNFHIIIWGDDIFVRGNEYIQEYEDTGMAIEVTPDNVLENDDE
jgi:hypothetical protein